MIKRLPSTSSTQYSAIPERAYSRALMVRLDRKRELYLKLPQPTEVREGGPST